MPGVRSVIVGQGRCSERPPGTAHALIAAIPLGAAIRGSASDPGGVNSRSDRVRAFRPDRGSSRDGAGASRLPPPTRQHHKTKGLTPLARLPIARPRRRDPRIRPARKARSPRPSHRPHLPLKEDGNGNIAAPDGEADRPGGSDPVFSDSRQTRRPLHGAMTAGRQDVAERMSVWTRAQSPQATCGYTQASQILHSDLSNFSCTLRP